MCGELFDVPKLASKKVRRRLTKLRLFLKRFSERMREQHPQVKVLDLDFRRTLVDVTVDQFFASCPRTADAGQSL